MAIGTGFTTNNSAGQARSLDRLGKLTGGDLPYYFPGGAAYNLDHIETLQPSEDTVISSLLDENGNELWSATPGAPYGFGAAVLKTHLVINCGIRKHFTYVAITSGGLYGYGPAQY